MQLETSLIFNPCVQRSTYTELLKLEKSFKTTESNCSPNMAKATANACP